MSSLQRELTVSSWNIRGLGDKYTDDLFIDNIKSDINVILETWKRENAETQIENFVSISKCRKKHKKSKRHSGGIIIYIKKEIFKGITNLSKASTSPNRIWLKLDKSFFGYEKDLFLCAVYIPPYNSTHLDDDFQNLENEIVKFAVKGEIALIGDFNARGDWVEPENKTHIEEIENFLSDLNNYKDNNITDKPITITDVKRVIKSLKVEMMYLKKYSKQSSYVNMVNTML
ncbi:unnamed protein product [Mytilus coruscus]|uniref:Endonuclease/exonuclease/phosphatase domain-containing protein n=1 Tax=Mytilus coruscus TaxID=42192 RepID=A0A6J8E497_MYTCO|nr:unnamed protein product [Mytilus coruscus]